MLRIILSLILFFSISMSTFASNGSCCCKNKHETSHSAKSGHADKNNCLHCLRCENVLYQYEYSSVLVSTYLKVETHMNYQFQNFSSTTLNTLF